MKHGDESGHPGDHRRSRRPGAIPEREVDLDLTEPAVMPELMRTSDHINNHTLNGDIEIAPADDPRELIRRMPQAHGLASMALAAALTIDLGPFIEIASKNATPAPSRRMLCHIRITSIVFTGEPGQVFTYDRETFTVPATGSIEIVANQKATTFVIDGRSIRLAGPLDQFSAMHVDLRHHARIY